MYVNSEESMRLSSLCNNFALSSILIIGLLRFLVVFQKEKSVDWVVGKLHKAFSDSPPEIVEFSHLVV